MLTTNKTRNTVTNNPIDTANTWRLLNPTTDPLASLTQDFYHTVKNEYVTNITVGNKKYPGMESIFTLQPTKTHSTPEFSRQITLFLVPLCRNCAKFFRRDFLHFLRTFGEHFFEVRAPKMELTLRLEFLEIGTGRYSSAPTFFQNLTRTKYAGLNFGCGGRSGLPWWRRLRLVSEAAAGAAAATTAGKAWVAGAWVAEAPRPPTNLGLRRRGLAEPPSPTGPRKLFKEVTVAHVGRHCSGFPGYFLSGPL